MTDWSKRWGGYEPPPGIEMKMITFQTDSELAVSFPYVGNGGDNEGGFIVSATATYEFTVTPHLNNEFVIIQKGVGHFKYRKGATPILVEK